LNWKPIGVPVKEIKKKNSPIVMGEKETSGLLVIIQEFNDCKSFVRMNIF